jgi:hypothetical protein
MPNQVVVTASDDASERGAGIAGEGKQQLRPRRKNPGKAVEMGGGPSCD